LVPPAPVSAQLPSGLWKKASSRATARAVPPILSNRPLALNGTIQVYCAALPSANPLLLAGLNDRQEPFESRSWM
jgi:hypothetical protein